MLTVDADKTGVCVLVTDVESLEGVDPLAVLSVVELCSFFVWLSAN